MLNIYFSFCLKITYYVYIVCECLCVCVCGLWWSSCSNSSSIVVINQICIYNRAV